MVDHVIFGKYGAIMMSYTNSMASKVPIFHLEKLDFLVIYDCPRADTLGQSNIPLK